MIRLLPLVVVLAIQSIAQDWHAVDVWGYPPPKDAQMENGFPTLQFPDRSSQISAVAFLTTTNTPELLGDLTGNQIIAEITIITSGPAVFFLPTSTPGLPPNVRLFFTTSAKPYAVCDANRDETAYWWADAAWLPLNRGAYQLEATLTPDQWSDALGHSASDPTYTGAFLDAVANVRQIGFSFGGGCFYDVGVGIVDPNTSATFRVRSYTVTPLCVLNPWMEAD